MENRRIKLIAHRDSLVAQFDPDPAKVSFADRDRVAEVERQISRMDNQIIQYRAKLDRFEGLAGDR